MGPQRFTLVSSSLGQMRFCVKAPEQYLTEGVYMLIFLLCRRNEFAFACLPLKVMYLLILGTAFTPFGREPSHQIIYGRPIHPDSG